MPEYSAEAATRATRRFYVAYQQMLDLALAMPEGAPSNCAMWAARMDARIPGGQLICVQSAFGPWKHWLWRSPVDGVVRSFEPNESKPDILARTEAGTPPTLFEGHVEEWPDDRGVTTP